MLTRRIFMIVQAFTLIGAAAAHTETIRMDDIDIEGRVHKPEVMFITDSGRQVPEGEGVWRLEEDFLHQIVEEAKAQAKHSRTQLPWE
jgi:hypothetical protein